VIPGGKRTSCFTSFALIFSASLIVNEHAGTAGGYDFVCELYETTDA
jgi:hypothetical protein